MRIKSTLKKSCPRTQLCLKHVSGAVWAGELGKSESTEARLAKPSKLGPDAGSTYRRPGLGGRQQRHGDLGEVIEDEEIQLPSVQQLRNWQKRPSGRGTLARPYPRCWPAPPGRAAQPRPGRLRNGAVYGAGAAAARRARPAPVPRPLRPAGSPRHLPNSRCRLTAHLLSPCPPRSPRRSRCAPRRPPGAHSLRCASGSSGAGGRRPPGVAAPGTPAARHSSWCRGRERRHHSVCDRLTQGWGGGGACGGDWEKGREKPYKTRVRGGVLCWHRSVWRVFGWLRSVVGQ